MDFNQLLKSNYNPFKKRSQEEILNEKELEKAVKNDIIQFSQVAKDLFSDQRYERLKGEFQKIAKNNIKLLVHYSNLNDAEYCTKMREYQIQIRTLLSIFDTPQGFINQADRILREK